MAPSLLASFPTFPSLALPGPSSLPCSSSYDPIHGSRGRDFGFDDDDDEADEYENCLCPGRKYPRTTRMYTSNNNHNTSFSGRASRLTRRISGSSSCSSLSSLSSKTGGLTKGARKFVRNLFCSRPSENEWKRVEEQAAAAAAAAAAADAQAAVIASYASSPTCTSPSPSPSSMTVIPFLTRMADGYTCFDMAAPLCTTSSWKRSGRVGRIGTSRFYEHTEEYRDGEEDCEEALVPLFRCPAIAGGLRNLSCVPSDPSTGTGERRLSVTEAWAWW